MKRVESTVIGVDPGLKGAIVVIFPDGVTLAFDMPVIVVKEKKKKSKKHVYDIDKIIKIIKDIKSVTSLCWNKNIIVFLEKVQILPRGFTIKSNLGLARCEAIFETILHFLDIKYEFVNPRVWQRFYGISSKNGDTKEQSIKKAKELYPRIILETKRGRVLDGRADAVLVANYGLDKMNK